MDLQFLLVDHLIFHDPLVCKASYHCVECDSFESDGLLPLVLIAGVPYLKIAGKCDRFYNQVKIGIKTRNVSDILKINF